MLSATNPGFGSLKENPRQPFLGQSISFPAHLPHILPFSHAVFKSPVKLLEHTQLFPDGVQKVGGWQKSVFVAVNSLAKLLISTVTVRTPFS
jgi:hypothetical protein